MARMYAKIRSATLNAGLLKSGNRFKKNRNLEVEIDIPTIANLVYQEVMKKIDNADTGVEKPDKTSLTDPEGKKAKERGKWKLSVVGFTMLSSQIIASIASGHRATASGDNAQMAQTTYTNIKGTGTLLLSTFGGKYGMVATVLLNRIDGFVGQAVKNQIQLQYDNARLDYNLTRLDIGRNSTYTYDYEQNKWIARDTQRVKNSVLHQNTSV